MVDGESELSNRQIVQREAPYESLVWIEQVLNLSITMILSIPKRHRAPSR